MAYWRVFNIRNTSGRICACGSWLQHWRNETRSRRRVCSILGCGNDATVGAHIIHADGRASSEWWIVPMCGSCNHSTNADVMFLKEDVLLVAANSSAMGCYVPMVNRRPSLRQRY